MELLSRDVHCDSEKRQKIDESFEKSIKLRKIDRKRARGEAAARYVAKRAERRGRVAFARQTAAA